MKGTLISLATSLVVFWIAIPRPCFANPQNSISPEESVNTDAIMQSESTSATIGQEMGHDKKLTDEPHYINSHLFDIDYEIFEMNMTLKIILALLISLCVCFALAAAFLILSLHYNLKKMEEKYERSLRERAAILKAEREAETKRISKENAEEERKREEEAHKRAMEEFLNHGYD